MTTVITQAGERESWMWTIERFQKLRAPEFQGGSDPHVEDKWNEDVGNILDLRGVDPIPTQRLAAFNMKGYASKWYRSQFSEGKRLTPTWAEFI